MKHRELYDNYFSFYLSQRGKEGTPAAYDHFYRWWKQNYIRKWLPENRQARVLEIGCGLGYHLHALSRLGYSNLEGIDLSPELIEMARANVPQVEFSLADAFAILSQQSGIYDLVIMSNIIEHFTKDEAVEICQLVFNSLRPQGIVLIKTTMLPIR